MYYYIYDEFVQDKKYERELLNIETRLTDLGIAGKISRLALFKRADELIRDETKRGVTTIVAVGNDDTVHKVIDVVADTGVTFGLIPLGPKNTIAKLLGIPEGLAACDVLSNRIIETIDTGMLNGKRFVTGVSIPRTQAEITCEGKYRIHPTQDGTIEVRNLACGEVTDATDVSNPRDGLFDTVIRVMTNRGGRIFRKMRMGQTVLPLRSLAIRSQDPIAVLADGNEILGTRFDITVEPLNLHVITGKARMF